MTIPRLVVAGMRSGSGKTTVCCALAAGRPSPAATAAGNGVSGRAASEPPAAPLGGGAP